MVNASQRCLLDVRETLKFVLKLLQEPMRFTSQESIRLSFHIPHLISSKDLGRADGCNHFLTRDMNEY